MSLAYGGGMGRVGGGGGCRGGGGGGNNRRRTRKRPRQGTGLKLTVFCSLPPQLRSQVIGRGGSNIKAIQEVSGAKITIPPAGRQGRVKVQGANEVSLLAACRRIMDAVKQQGNDLECTVDAGPAVGRMKGTLYVPRDDQQTLLFDATTRAQQPPSGTTAETGSGGGASGGITYTSHAIQSVVTREEVEITLDNLSFATGADLDGVYAGVKDGHVFISGLVTESVDLVVGEMKKLTRSTKGENSQSIENSQSMEDST